jgi:MFS family permease
MRESRTEHPSREVGAHLRTATEAARRPLFAVAALAVGFGSTATSAALLAASPGHSWPIALVSTALGGAGPAVVFPVTDSLLANAVPDHSRAKVMAAFCVVLFAVSSPFSWIGGLLSAVSPRLPLALVAALCLPGLALSALVFRAEARAR